MAIQIPVLPDVVWHFDAVAAGETPDAVAAADLVITGSTYSLGTTGAVFDNTLRVLTDDLIVTLPTSSDHAVAIWFTPAVYEDYEAIRFEKSGSPGVFVSLKAIKATGTTLDIKLIMDDGVTPVTQTIATGIETGTRMMLGLQHEAATEVIVFIGVSNFFWSHSHLASIPDFSASANVLSFNEGSGALADLKLDEGMYWDSGISFEEFRYIHNGHDGRLYDGNPWPPDVDYLTDGQGSYILVTGPILPVWDAQIESIKVTPPAVEGGDAIDLTTMSNDEWQTFGGKTLKELGDVTTSISWDPELYEDLTPFISKGVERDFYVVFPDGTSLKFQGEIKSFTPDTLTIGERPTATIVIIATLRTAGVETPPEFTNVP